MSDFREKYLSEILNQLDNLVLYSSIQTDPCNNMP